MFRGAHSFQQATADDSDVGVAFCFDTLIQFRVGSMIKLSAVCVVVMCAAIAGCGGGGSAGADPVYEVSGVVTFGNQPVVGADVTFFNAEKSRSAFGRTNDRGEYKLTTFNANDGAVEGKSAVSIIKYVPPVAAAPEADVESEAYELPEVAEAKAPPKPKSEIPDRYSDQATSGLIAVVNPDQENKIDFVLEK